MATIHYDRRRTTPSRWLLTGFVAGAIAVLVFHQGALAMLYQLGLTSRAPFAMAPTPPWGVPALWSLAFWGGVWGMLLAAALNRLDSIRLVVAATFLGALAPTLMVWFAVAPMKGQPILAGGDAKLMAIALFVNAAWGLGTGIGLLLFGRSHSRGGLIRF